MSENIILRAYTESYVDIMIKDLLKLFGLVASSVKQFKR